MKQQFRATLTQAGHGGPAHSSGRAGHVFSQLLEVTRRGERQVYLFFLNTYGDEALIIKQEIFK